ncbi:MAG: type III-B CRISPR-associated protein Cas10/Cmr2 [Enhydrobacter sp.]|nr:MAG: type III-B CRISPR-associated protein Cas10/Cmr2 [Enhydrobacter sp.]
MNERQVFRFSLGPVQAFIAQARRTRDLWAGSFLLSWLAGHAMAAVRAKAGWDIAFPDVAGDALISAIEKNDGEPLLATLPNQFKAVGPDNGFDPDAVVAAVRAAWLRVAQEVYEQFVKPVEVLGNGTADVWHAQVQQFWEINWVLGPADGSEGGWLEARKNWRSHRPPDQGGEHCTLMGDWQELSGWSRIGKRAENNGFWDALRRGDRLDLRDGERLCALALIKRLFPRLERARLERAIRWVPGGDPMMTVNWPSTGHVAAARWLAAAARRKEAVDACDALAAKIDGNLSNRHFGEQNSRVRCVAAAAAAFAGGGHSFAALDSSFLRLDDLMNPRTLPLLDRGGDPLEVDADREQRATLRGLHRAIGEAAGRSTRAGGGPLAKEPPSYYALLLMDGDRVGPLLDGERDADVSRALADFTRAVTRHFGLEEGHPAATDGVAIYAGGDDVLALLAVEAAIGTASALADAYRDAFRARGVQAPGGGVPDISAAIVFADHHEPFRDVLALAHKLLDGTAKEANGRASLAIGVQRPSGLAATWVGKWRLPGARPPEVLAAQAASSDTSGRFPYLLRARYLAPAAGKFAEIGFTNADIGRIFAHELGKSRTPVGKDADIAALQMLARPATARAYDDADEARVPGLDEGGLLVARFLGETMVRP